MNVFLTWKERLQSCDQIRDSETGGITLDCPDGFNITIRVLIRERGRQESQRSRCDDGSRGQNDVIEWLSREKGATSQGWRAASGSWKRQKHGFAVPPERMAALLFLEGQ